MDENYQFKIIIDENLSRRLIATLGSAFPETTHVGLKNLLEVEDKGIWDFALQREYCILTKDHDYKFMSVAYGCPPKVIRLNCGNKTTTYIADLLKQKLEVIEEFLVDNDNCYLEIE
jgi:predicted nuclease of predicted toxin-antitoxin system